MAANPYASPRSPGIQFARHRVNRCRKWFVVGVFVFLIIPATLFWGPLAYAAWRPLAVLDERWFPIVKFCALAAVYMLLVGAPVLGATGAAWLKEEKRDRLDGKTSEGT